MQIALVGNVMIGRQIGELLERVPPQYPWDDTIELLKSSDIRICNLECVLSSKNSPDNSDPGTYNLRSDAKHADSLSAAGFNVVSLANDHTLDLKTAGLKDTLQALRKNNIESAGAGVDSEQARSPAIITINDIRVGIIAFSDQKPDWEAAKSQPGINYCPADSHDPRAKRLLQSISDAHSQVDVLIVSAHWGPEWGYSPPPEQMPFAHAMINAGADIIYGHSGRVFRGIEIYRDRPILYCCGDFIDDFSVDPIQRNDESFIFMAEIDGPHSIASIKLYPTVIRALQARLAPPGLRHSIAQKAAELSTRFGTKSQWQPDKSALYIPIRTELDL